MDGLLILRAVCAFVFVLALMGVTAWAFKRSGFAGKMAAVSGKRRLGVVETLAVDSRRRLMLVRRDDREHLLLLGPSGETVVETDIKEQKNA